MAKKIKRRSQLVGARGEALVGKELLDLGFCWHPTNKTVEAGIDGFFEPIDLRSEVVRGEFAAAQVKTSAAVTANKSGAITFACTKDDIAYWLGCNLPVFLFLVDLNQKVAYWKQIASYFRDNPQTQTVKFDSVADKLNEESAQRLRGQVPTIPTIVATPPAPLKERLHTNLFPLVYPSRICAAPTPHTSRDHIKAILRAKHECWDTDWILSGGHLLSFRPLDGPAYRDVCQSQNVTTYATGDWAASSDPRRRDEFRKLLYACLGEKCKRLGLLFCKDSGRYYFPHTQGGLPRLEEYVSLKVKTSRTVFQGYPTPGKPSECRYFRHAAFEAQMITTNDAWYCCITPGYVFTRDGRVMMVDDSKLQSGIKRLERNSAVLGQSVFWLRYLGRRQQALFGSTYKILEFSEAFRQDLRSGVDDDGWLNDEDEEEADILGHDDGMFDAEVPVP